LFRLPQLEQFLPSWGIFFKKMKIIRLLLKTLGHPWWWLLWKGTVLAKNEGGRIADWYEQIKKKQEKLRKKKGEERKKEKEKERIKAKKRGKTKKKERGKKERARKSWEGLRATGYWLKGELNRGGEWLGKRVRKLLTWRWFLLGLVLSLVFLGFLTGMLWRFFQRLPSVTELQEPPSLTSRITDREGRVLYKFYEKQNRTWVEIEKVPQNLIWATVAIEDKNFWQHNGFSAKGILRAAWHNWRHPEAPLMGGSTITQQLVKNKLIGGEKTWERKLREMVLAVLAEMKFEKEEILEFYFNQIAYGGEIYGAEEAALSYFGKHVWEIDLAEAAFLAGLPAAPTTYSPNGSQPELAKARQEKVLEEMRAAGYIEEEAKNLAREEEIEVLNRPVEIIAPHFVFYVRDLLAEKMGIRKLESAGLTIKTSLDLDIQREVEKIVEEELAKVERLRISNGAALVTRPETGEVLAMVGSRDYWNGKIDGNVNVVLRPRQPGSSIKPVNYLAALEKGFTAATVIPDTAIVYKLPGQEDYSPRNYDNKYRGNVSLRTALASSLNVPAVKVLAAIGVDSMIDMGEKMGINTWGERKRFGLSLTLGGGEVKMIEMAEVYGTLANSGERVEIRPILEIEDFQGKSIYKAEVQRRKVVSEELAFLINDILADNRARAPVFGTNSLLVIPGKTVAVKTGTTNSLRDNWCLGYTPEVLVAAWVGNNDNSPMSWVASGVSGATPIWQRIMAELLEGREDQKWEVPESLEKINICRQTGTLPCEGCPEIGEEYFLPGTAPRLRCIKITASPTPTP